MAPIRLDNQLKAKETKPVFDFEDDVKFQMQQLENEMKLMLTKDHGVSGNGPVPSKQLANNDTHNTFQQEHFSTGRSNPTMAANTADMRINPKDWKAKGYPSEFAYMKAMGQLDIKPDVEQSKPSLQPTQNPAQVGHRGDNGYISQPYNDPQSSAEKKYEREMVSPARRKGGAIQNLYAEEEDLRRKFASQHSYSDQLQKQVLNLEPIS